MPDDSRIVGLYGSDGVAIHARRQHTDDLCARVFGPSVDSVGSVALHYFLGSTAAELRQYTQVVAAGDVQTLALGQDGRFEWPATEKRGVNEHESSLSFVAVDFSGSIAVGDLAAGTVTEVSTLALQPGQYSNARVHDDDVFVSRWTIDHTEWWLYRSGSLVHFVGDPDSHVDDLATDGKTIVWKQGRDAVGQGLDRVWKFDLYLAPYVSDPANLEPKLILQDVPPSLGSLKVSNGWVSGVFRTTTPPEPYDSAVLVVRLADSWALRGKPGEFNFAQPVFSTPTHVIGAITAGSLVTEADTVLSMPFTAMDEIQAPQPTD